MSIRNSRLFPLTFFVRQVFNTAKGQLAPKQASIISSNKLNFMKDPIVECV